jgi:type IV secretory pathway VirB2 component (pilin)
MTNKKTMALMTMILVLGFTTIANATTSSMPWDAPLTDVLNALTGTTVRTIAAIAIVIAGLSIAFGESGGMFTRAAQIIFGISLALMAVSFVAQLFGAGTGLLF